MLSSELILQAEKILATWYNCGPDGMLTYVWDSKIKSINPGCCFKKAGWHKNGYSQDGVKTLLHKDFSKAGIIQ